MAADIPAKPEDKEGDGCWLSMHARFLSQGRDKEPEILFIGDSILFNFEATQTYKTYIEPLYCLNFSIPNDETQNVLWRVLNGELDEVKVKVVVMAVGTHNKCSAAEIVNGVLSILKVVKEKQPEARIVVLGLLPCGKKPNPRRAKHLEVNRLLAANLSHPGGRVVFLCPEWDALLQPDGSIAHRDMLDYLHPTEAGYVKFIEPLVEELQTSLQTFLKTNAPSSSPL
uniref:Platelet activating factor acetylhydrolase IB n=1 Tax=Echinococcus granulosus TaxID=6210 RepID=A0A068WT96_ECHGR|nr:platelet activating factor acetylhydrolase IB [Echinococcus granulosus]